MPRPGSHQYDIEHARLRKRLENEAEAVDKEADRESEVNRSPEQEMATPPRSGEDGR